MANRKTCDRCGNTYERAFTVTLHDGRSGNFDSFECAIAKMAPACDHCDTRIIGHGRETADGTYYCCGHCAEKAGATLEA